jgi:hypothetical protein
MRRSAWSTCARPRAAPIPPNTLDELRRDLERKRLIAEQIRQIEKVRPEQLKQAPNAGPNLMVLLLMRVIGIGIETADMLGRCCHATCAAATVARYGGLTGSPDESDSTRRVRAGATCRLRLRCSFPPAQTCVPKRHGSHRQVPGKTRTDLGETLVNE